MSVSWKARSGCPVQGGWEGVRPGQETQGRGGGGDPWRATRTDVSKWLRAAQSDAPETKLVGLSD